MYAMSAAGFRAVSGSMALVEGEVLVEELSPAILLTVEIQQGRARRDALLRASDWTQAGDSPLTVEARATYAAYRAELRALPAKPEFPDCEWPMEPSASGRVALPFEGPDMRADL